MLGKEGKLPRVEIDLEDSSPRSKQHKPNLFLNSKAPEDLKFLDEIRDRVNASDDEGLFHGKKLLSSPDSYWKSFKTFDLNTITDGAKKLGSGVKNLGGDIASGVGKLGTGVKNLGGDIAGGVSKIGSEAKNLGGSMVDKTKNLGSSVVEKTKNAAGNLVHHEKIVTTTVTTTGPSGEKQTQTHTVEEKSVFGGFTGFFNSMNIFKDDEKPHTAPKPPGEQLPQNAPAQNPPQPTSQPPTQPLPQQPSNPQAVQQQMVSIVQETTTTTTKKTGEQGGAPEGTFTPTMLAHEQIDQIVKRNDTAPLPPLPPPPPTFDPNPPAKDNEL